MSREKRQAINADTRLSVSNSKHWRWSISSCVRSEECAVAGRTFLKWAESTATLSNDLFVRIFRLHVIQSIRNKNTLPGLFHAPIVQTDSGTLTFYRLQCILPRPLFLYRVLSLFAYINPDPYEIFKQLQLLLANSNNFSYRKSTRSPQCSHL